MFWNFIKIYIFITIAVILFIAIDAKNYLQVGLDFKKEDNQNEYFVKTEIGIELHYINTNYIEYIRKIYQSYLHHISNIDSCKKYVNFHCFTNSKNLKSIFYDVVKANLFAQKETFKIPKGHFISNKYGSNGSNIKNISEMLSTKVQDVHNSFDDLADYGLYISIGMCIIMLIFFTLFIIAANSLYRRFKIKRECKKILSMNDASELISIINHQIKQPINTLLLVTSSIMDSLSKKESLDMEDLIEKLKLSKNNILLINKTIDTFRNFYKLDSIITEFELKSCVENILYITRNELILGSITTQLDTSNIEGLKIRSIENFIQQVLLVLIQNAKEAILPLQVIKQLPRRKIEIKFETDDEFAHIFVSDFGVGINEDMQKRLFTKLKNSAKSKERGIGLFFSKRLAKNNLKGDLMLINSKMPTTFKFTIAKDIKRNNAKTNSKFFKRILCVGH